MTTIRPAALALLALALGAGEVPAWKQPFVPQGDAWRRTPQELTFNNGAEPETLDPAKLKGVLESRIVIGLFEGLVTYDPRTLEPRPGIASSWTVSPDGLAYTFTLRDDARWSDGSPLVAADVAASWRRVLLPETGSEYVYMLFPIAGAEEFHRGPERDFSRVGVKATAERTLEVRLRAPCAWFLDLCGFHTLMPTPARAVAQHGDRWERAEHMVCNGPYRLAAWEPRSRIVLEPNPHYWDRGFVKLQRISILPLSDPETAYKQYQLGQIHWLTSVPAFRIEEVKRNPDYYALPYLGTYFYRFNCAKPPFDDKRVRRAFVQALKREQITKHLLKGGEIPVTSFVPPVAGYEPIAGLREDAAAAARLLADAGYAVKGAAGKPVPEIELLFNEEPRHKQVAEAVAQQWRDALGVQVSLRNAEWKVYLQRMDTLDYQLSRSAWIGDYNDPMTFLDMWVKDGGNNRTGWSSSTYDALVREAAAAVDRTQQLGLYKRMEQLLVEDECPICPIYRYVNQGLLSERVRGWQSNIRDLHAFQYLWME